MGVNRFGRAGGIGFGHGGGPAGEDDAFRREVLQRGFGDAVEGLDFAVDAGFAHAPGDQLGDLGTEINDQQTVAHGPI